MQYGADCRKVCARIKIFGDAYRVSPHRLVYIVVSVDIDTEHELDALASLGLAETAGFVDIFSDEMQSHICNFRALHIRDSCTLQLQARVSNHYRPLHEGWNSCRNWHCHRQYAAGCFQLQNDPMGSNPGENQQQERPAFEPSRIRSV